MMSLSADRPESGTLRKLELWSARRISFFS
jgi:hypothetical protein